MAIHQSQTQEAVSHLSASRETRIFWPADVFLRKFGFTIVSRRKDEEPIWADKLGKRFTESAALELANAIKAS